MLSLQGEGEERAWGEGEEGGGESFVQVLPWGKGQRSKGRAAAGPRRAEKP
jgi:hypothetical protein